MKNLENYGVLEMNAKEMKETDGGNWLRLVRVVAVAVAALHEELCDGDHSVPSYVSGGLPYNR